MESGHKGVSKSQSGDSGPLGPVCPWESPPHTDSQASAELIRLPGRGPDWLHVYPVPSWCGCLWFVAALGGHGSKKVMLCVESWQQGNVCGVTRPRILPLGGSKHKLGLGNFGRKGLHISNKLQALWTWLIWPQSIGYWQVSSCKWNHLGVSVQLNMPQDSNFLSRILLFSWRKCLFLSSSLLFFF